MTHKMTLLDGRKVDIDYPYCNNYEFRSQGLEKIYIICFNVPNAVNIIVDS